MISAGILYVTLIHRVCSSDVGVLKTPGCFETPRGVLSDFNRQSQNTQVSDGIPPGILTFQQNTLGVLQNTRVF